MKHLLNLLLLTIAATLSAQNLSGYWEGKIGITKTDSLTVGLQIDYQGDTLYAELDSPDQYFTGQPVSGLTFADSAIAFRVPDFGLNYEGTLSADGQRFTGTCTQYGRKFDCTLSLGATRKFFPRPQTPTPPYPYRTEEVHFRDRSGKKPLINGTLTLPQGQPKGLIIFISGSGWQDRDESLFAHKPFAVIADTLTKAGFATYRYDDFPAAIFRKSTTYDFADGVRLILDSLLQRVELQGLEVGLLGHSEGSLVASMVAADDKRIAFTIHLGGVAQPRRALLLRRRPRRHAARGRDRACGGAGRGAPAGGTAAAGPAGTAEPRPQGLLAPESRKAGRPPRRGEIRVTSAAGSARLVRAEGERSAADGV